MSFPRGADRWLCFARAARPAQIQPAAWLLGIQLRVQERLSERLALHADGEGLPTPEELDEWSIAIEGVEPRLSQPPQRVCKLGQHRLCMPGLLLLRPLLARANETRAGNEPAKVHVADGHRQRGVAGPIAVCAHAIRRRAGRALVAVG
jgi:hypothetical protein